MEQTEKSIGKTSKPISQSQLNDVIAALSQTDFTPPVPKKAVKKTEAKETTPRPKPKALTPAVCSRSNRNGKKICQEL